MPLKSEHLLVSLGKWVSRLLRFPDFQIVRFSIYGKHVGNSGFERSKKNNKGVLGRPWAKRRVLRVISSTLKFQYFRKLCKSTCSTFGKTRSCESSRGKFRMVRALLTDTPRPSQFQPELQFFHFAPYFRFFQFFPGSLTSTPSTPSTPSTVQYCSH